MRNFMFRLGWAILFSLPIVYAVQIFMTEDLPPVQWWKWVILLATVIVIYLSRNRDEVLKHHVV